MPPRAATAGQWRSYSVLITEDLNLRVVPEPLCEVLSPEQYERLFGQIKKEQERTRVVGTRLLRVATLVPCIVLCLVRAVCCACTLRGAEAPVQVPLLMRRMARLDAALNARLQALCDAAAAERRGIRFHVRQLGGVAASRASRQPHQIWIDVQFADLGGKVGGDLYVLQPPSAPAEAPPPPEAPPDVFTGSDDDDHPISAADEEGSRLLSRMQLPFTRRHRQGTGTQQTDPSIALITVVDK